MRLTRLEFVDVEPFLNVADYAHAAQAETSAGKRLILKGGSSMKSPSRKPRDWATELYYRVPRERGKRDLTMMVVGQLVAMPTCRGEFLSSQKNS